MSLNTSLDWTSNLTPYTGAAAGHEGLSSNASGSLIIKPCTQAEIDFYESAKHHPEFQAHMPTYMGNLTLNQDMATQALSHSSKEHQIGVALMPTLDTAAGADGTPVKETDVKPWVPSGGKKLSTGLAIVLENATTGFKRPNVLDLKLGSRLWDDDAPDAKRQKLDQVAKETTSGSLGFRVAGMKIWIAGSGEDEARKEVNTEVKDGYKNFNKMYGRSLTESNVQDAFIRFMGGQSEQGNDSGMTQFSKPVANVLLQRLSRELESVQYVLEGEESRMYSASVLVVAEGDNEALKTALAEEPKFLQRQQKSENEVDVEESEGDADINDEEEDSDEEIGPRILEVRLIDFAHASWAPGQGSDENALNGVRNIKRIVDGLIRNGS